MRHALRESLAAFRRTPLLSFLSVAMVALALVVVGLFGLAAHNLQVALDQVEERVEVVGYLHDDVSQRDVDALMADVQDDPAVAEVRYVSREEALEKAREDLPEFQEVFTGLEINPLPASLEVRLRQEDRGTEAVERLAASLEEFSAVEEVRYGRDWVERLFFLRTAGAVTAGILGLGFGLVGALIIGTAVRMAVFARREEIYVMRLVGATQGFVRRPFLLEGAITGLLGGLAALAAVWGVHAAVERWIFSVGWLPGAWVLAGLGVAMVLGVAASGLAVRRYLRVIE